MKPFLFTIVFALSLLSLSGQNTVSRENLLEERTRFFQKELSLNEKETAAVREALVKLEDARMELWREVRALRRELKQKKNPTQQEVERLEKMRCRCRKKDAQLVEDFYMEMAKVLPPEKLLRLDDARLKFARQYAKESL